MDIEDYKIRPIQIDFLSKDCKVSQNQFVTKRNSSNLFNLKDTCYQNIRLTHSTNGQYRVSKEVI